MTTTIPSDPYRVLGVDQDADTAAIKTAYRKLVLKCHPDKVTDPTLKAEKQEEFQKVQQSYETLIDPEKRQQYELEQRARKSREERDSRATPTKTTPTTTRHTNVHIFTAHPPPEFRSSSSKHSPSKTASYKPYGSGTTYSKSFDTVFNTSSRPKPYYEENNVRTRRSVSDEKLKRDDSRDRRRRVDEDREWERRKREEDREIKRQKDQMKERERERERDRERERERLRREAKARERDREEREARDRAAKKSRERADRERDREREKRKQAEAEEKSRAKMRGPYVEDYSEDDAEGRRSRGKKSPKKDTASTRDKSSSKLRERSSPRDAVSPSLEIPVRVQSRLAYAANYIQSSKPSPKHVPEAPVYSDSYPDPENWKRRGSGEGKKAKPDAIHIVDGGSPSRDRPEVVTVSPIEQPPHPRLYKSQTMPPNYIPTTTDAPYPSSRGPLNRAHTMEPEYLSRSDRHKPSRVGRSSLEESRDDLYFDEKKYGGNRTTKVQTYTIGRDKGTPRVLESTFKDPFPSSSTPSASWGAKYKTSQQYRPEQVSTSRPYVMDDLQTSNYQPTTFAVYSEA